MSYTTTMYVKTNFTKAELDELLKGCSSIKKDSPLIFKQRAILKDGKPVPLDEYMILSGERVMLEVSDKYLENGAGIKFQLPLPEAERNALIKVKKEFKKSKILKYNSMKRFEQSRIAIPAWEREFWLIAKELLFPNE